MIPKILMTGSAGLILALGIVHLIYTFHGPKLIPRDPALEQKMQQVSPVVTSETTMWRVWIGVNATHSLALILFGLVYGYLAVSNSELLFGSPILQAIGFGMLLGVAVIARLYFFSVPFWGVCLSLLCYAGSILMSLLRSR